ncbi:MAG: hypothetical protein S4CHLAM81_06070 [Chlamydiales bacterium]|nr:hypothetical protein [Chlamydiales bacterium]MCH9635391.1 hypothetical protein [Chlamydiales bacterium]MCH9704339.1 hypothetical protein [Chlamydiota bacterium]
MAGVVDNLPSLVCSCLPEGGGITQGCTGTIAVVSGVASVVFFALSLSGQGGSEGADLALTVTGLVAVNVSFFSTITCMIIPCLKDEEE